MGGGLGHWGLTETDTLQSRGVRPGNKQSEFRGLGIMTKGRPGCYGRSESILWGHCEDQINELKQV